MNQKIENIITMIGCNRSEFLNIIKNACGNISMSSGSYYSPYYILDSKGILAKYQSDGQLIYCR